MHISETWGIPAERIIDYLLSLENVRQSGFNCYTCQGIDVRLTLLPDQAIGSFVLPRTQVDFLGENDAVESFHHRFVIQFISAGG